MLGSGGWYSSHHPKVSKDHLEMVENLDTILAYPWGRLTFEMIMTSIKGREVAALATSIAVQGFIYALQLVVMQPVPSIQDGHVGG